ncbi:hypothetical protein EJB05_29408, partial [Eragrostis curvula]
MGSIAEVDPKNIVKASFEEIPENVRKKFEEIKKIREEQELHELLSCFKKDRQGAVTQVKDYVPPSFAEKPPDNRGKSNNKVKPSFEELLAKYKRLQRQNRQTSEAKDSRSSSKYSEQPSSHQPQVGQKDARVQDWDFGA